MIIYLMKLIIILFT